MEMSWTIKSALKGKKTEKVIIIQKLVKARRVLTISWKQTSTFQ